MNLPELHPREAIVDAAEQELSQFYHPMQIEYADRFAAYAVMLHSMKMTTHAELKGKSRQFLEFLLTWRENHSLTTGELVHIIGRELSDDAKYIIRWERHKRTDKPGGLA